MKLWGTLATKLAQADRLRKRLQEELAARAGVNRNYIGILEREENAATVDMLEKLANVLGVDPVEFFERPSRKASHGKR